MEYKTDDKKRNQGFQKVVPIPKSSIHGLMAHDCFAFGTLTKLNSLVWFFIARFAFHLSFEMLQFWGNKPINAYMLKLRWNAKRTIKNETKDFRKWFRFQKAAFMGSWPMIASLLELQKN